MPGSDKAACSRGVTAGAPMAVATFQARVKSFNEAQRRTRWHYQWVVVHDFLPRLVGQVLVDELLAGGEIHTPHYRFRENPYMPVEFSVAA